MMLERKLSTSLYKDPTAEIGGEQNEPGQLNGDKDERPLIQPESAVSGDFRRAVVILTYMHYMQTAASQEIKERSCHLSKRRRLNFEEIKDETKCYKCGPLELSCSFSCQRTNSSGIQNLCCDHCCRAIVQTRIPFKIRKFL